MWKHILRSAIPLKCTENSLLTLPAQGVYQQYRTTFILKRRWPPGLYKKGQTTRKLKARHFVYDLVEDTNVRKKQELEVILTDYVAGLGNRGDRITAKQKFAYHELLLPGLAVYASPENIEKFSKIKDSTQKTKYSSPYVQKTMELLSNTNVVVLMNKETPWTVEPWHVRCSLRKAGIHVPEDAISLPEEPISGPNVDLEHKYFEVLVTINNTEKVFVKCVIRHWSTYVSEKSDPLENMHELSLEPLFPEKTSTNTSSPASS
ncbi:large ribosomal subunit protein bL9m [Periplaneta americana]|uniref:large ribosomal subunit protein bL9m n=1 Tax=Periplaneta americana TaxID=6978 RepID=UPI0037E87DD0